MFYNSGVFQEVNPEWQTAASGVLVALGHKYCNEVMEELVRKFQPGALPHYFVIHTMANLATANSKLLTIEIDPYVYKHLERYTCRCKIYNK